MNEERHGDAELEDVFVQFWLRNGLPISFVTWAERKLVEGKDSASLRILAGLSGNDRNEVMLYLERALKELGIALPEYCPCLLAYCKRIALQIVEGKVTPHEGYNLIYEVVIELEYPDELRMWIDIGMKFYPCEGADDEAEQVEMIIVEEAKGFVAKA